MTNNELEALKQDLKALIIEECDKEDEIELHEFQDDDTLFGRKSNIALDSLDALQLSMAIQKKYNVRIEGASAVRKHMKDVNTLAQHIASQTNA